MGFRLWSSDRSLSDKETRSADFFLPTANGWVDAKTAMYRATWDVPNGSKLQALLRITADDSDEFKVSLARLVSEFVAWPIRYEIQSERVRFLNPHYLEFYKRQGYLEIGEVAIGPVVEHVFFHANPQVSHTATA